MWRIDGQTDSTILASEDERHVRMSFPRIRHVEWLHHLTRHKISDRWRVVRRCGLRVQFHEK
jgi:hypothetical protein